MHKNGKKKYTHGDILLVTWEDAHSHYEHENDIADLCDPVEQHTVGFFERETPKAITLSWSLADDVNAKLYRFVVPKAVIVKIKVFSRAL